MRLRRGVMLFGNPVRSSPALSADGENGTSEAGSNRFRRKGA